MLSYGSDPLDSKSVANKFPDSLELHGSKILENQPKGSIIGQLIGHDPDNKATLIYSQVSEGNQAQSPVYVGPAGVVRTTRIFDYETNEKNYTLVAKVSDEHNFSIERSFTIQLLDQNEPPFELDILAPLRVPENQPVGTIVGKLTARDPDNGEVLTYQLLKDRDPISNESFTLDENGTLRTAEVLDYENNASLFIRAKATDKAGLLTKKGFVVEVINEIEDLDGDGTEDAHDDDIDGDGFSNEQELAYGSDPFDRQSVVNAPPTDIIMQGGEVKENQPVGTLVARFFAVDADTNDTFSYQLIDSANKETYPFKLSQRGGLRTTRKLDYESHAHDYSLTIRVMDDLNESFEKSFNVQLINQIEDLDGDGTEDAYDEDVDGDGFSNEQEREIGTSPTDRYSRPEKPILNSGIGRIDENGTIFLTGGIKANGGAEISDFGFVISSGISIDRRKSTVYWGLPNKLRQI